MVHESRELKISINSASVSGILDTPAKPKTGLTLAHGAGAGMRHAFMAELAGALVEAGFAVLRFQFPYMEAGQRRTDSPAVATATIAAAVETLRKHVSVPIFAGGKSFGARMITTAAAEGKLPEVRGIIAYGFPLHAKGEPSTKRAAHLEKVPTPMLFLQGARDDLAELELMRRVCAKLPQARLHVVEAADHSFAVLKRSGRTGDQVMAELVAESVRFRDGI